MAPVEPFEREAFLIDGRPDKTADDDADSAKLEMIAKAKRRVKAGEEVTVAQREANHAERQAQESREDSHFQAAVRAT